jgi:hypothetical protein
VAAVLITTSCGGQMNQIVEDRWEIAEASGAPEITAITDLGGTDVPLRGDLPLGATDGVATIGETLWIHGSSFGRQPSVSVGGRPAAVLGRTRDGGAVVRVPPGTPSGPQAVTVSNERGKGDKAVPIRRYGALMPSEGGKIGWVELTADGPIAAGETPAPGARLMALSADGRAAYIADPRRSSIDVLELPAPLTPKSIYKLDLDAQPVVALSAASRATMLAVVRAGDVVLLDTTSPLHPARSAPRALPAVVRDAGLTAAELSPDGKALAALTVEGNKLVLLDLVPRGKAALVAELSLAPETRVGILIDVAFSPDGQTLWVLAGDTAASRSSGPQPTTLFAVRLRGSARVGTALELARTIVIASAADPARVATGRALPLASGAAIRLPPEKATVFLSARGGVFRVDAADAATEAVTATGVVGRADVSPDGRWLLAPAVGQDGAGQVIAAPADGRPGQRKSVDVTRGANRSTSRAAAGARPPELRIQP